MVLNRAAVYAFPDEPEPADVTERFYGWRYQRVVNEAGEEHFEQVPLRSEDLMYPQEDDQVVHNLFHYQLCTDLFTICKNQVKHDPERFVTGDCLINWNVAGVQQLGPDITVVRGKPPPYDAGVIYLGRLDGEVELIIEVTSDSTRHLDFGPKLEKFHEAGVKRVLIIDADHPRFDGVHALHYHLWEPDGYNRLAVIRGGDLWLEPLRLGLAIEGGALRYFDENDVEIVPYGELSDQLIATKAEAMAERERAEMAQAEATAERERATAERERAEAAEARLRELEALLRANQRADT